MHWLEAALAFAVVMMMCSTIVAVIVETAHMLLRLREKGLRRFMEVIYRDVISPRFAEAERELTMADFVAAMTASRFRPVDAGAIAPRKLVPAIVNAGQLKNLGTLEFIERLTETAVGRRLVAEAEQLGSAGLDATLQELARKYEEFGASATEYFARRAKLVSVAVALGLAFALNINAVNLFETLLTDKVVRDAVIEQQEAVTQRIKDMQGATSAVSTAGSPGAAEAGMAAAPNGAGKMATPDTEIGAIRDTGLPFGWGHAPWNTPEWQRADRPVAAWLVIKWAVAVLLAGLLIGLGGPFWFDTFRKLATFTGVARAVRGQDAPPPREDGDRALRARSRTDYVRVFETAAEGRRLAARRSTTSSPAVGNESRQHGGEHERGMAGKNAEPPR